MRGTGLLLAIVVASLADSGSARPDAIAAAVASPARPEADRARDADRQPAEVLEVFGIAPGMKVADLAAGAGYYSEILAAGFEWVGESAVLRHPEDDRTQGVFADGLRGKTDRFVYRFRKPETPAAR